MPVNNNPSSENLEGVHGRLASPEEIARRDGYVQGRSDEGYVQKNLREHERIVAQARADDSAASGMVFGLAIAFLALGAGVAFYFLGGLGSDRSEIDPVADPQIQRERVIERETTIIERQAPDPPTSLPDVQTDVPAVEVPDATVTNEAPSEPAPVVEEPEAAESEAAPDEPQ